MKAIAVTLIALAMLCPTESIAAKSDSLWVGNMQIEIGMQKNEVLSTIGEGYEVLRDNIKSKDPTWENWSIYKKSDKRKAGDCVGHLAFQNNKVAWVSKIWGGVRGEEVASFGNNLAGILSKLIEKGKTNLTVRVREDREPGVTLKTIYFISGKYQFQIIVSDEGIGISEHLFKE